MSDSKTKRVRVADMDHKTIGMVATLDNDVHRVMGTLDGVEWNPGGSVSLSIAGDCYQVDPHDVIDLNFNSVMRNLHAMWKALQGFADEDRKPRIRKHGAQ